MINPRTVYIIDDDTDDLDLFCEAVRVVDSAIVCVKSNDSEAALKSFQTCDVPLPDLIFTDLNMPMVDGRQLLAALKSNSAYAHVPVIVYTTSNHPKDVEDVRQLGASYFFAKPYSLEKLITVLEDILWKDWRGGPFSSYTR